MAGAAQISLSWSRLQGTELSDEASSVAVGKDGSIYIAGQTEGNLAKQANANVGRTDAFLTKYNSDGIAQWTKLLGGEGADAATALTVANDGSILLTGYVIAVPVFKEGSFEGQKINGYDAFVTKWSNDGAKIWTRTVGGTGDEYAWAVASDKSGAIYVAGTMVNGIDGQKSFGGLDIFVTKFSSDGTKLWTKAIGTSGYDKPAAIVVGPDDALYLAGSTTGNLNGQTNNGGIHGAYNAFVSKLTLDGTPVWTRLIGSTSEATASSLVTSGDGSVYVVGTTFGNGAGDGDFDGQRNHGGEDGFVVKFKSDGTKVWTRIFGTDGVDNAMGASIGSDGGIYVAGSTTGSLDGQGIASPYGGLIKPTGYYGADMYIAYFSIDGNTLWTKQFGTGSANQSSDDLAKALVSGGSGTIYVVGSTQGTLGGQNKSGLYNYDAFLTKWTTPHTLTVLVDKGILGPNPVLLKDLVEEIRSGSGNLNRLDECNTGFFAEA